MQKSFYLFLLITLSSVQGFSQEFGTLSRTEDKGNAGQSGTKSGFFETSSPSNYPWGASFWWHLLDVRHSNPGNNFAMQFSGSFFDQHLYFRKTANNASQSWARILQERDGKVGIGTLNPNAILDISDGTDHNATNMIRIIAAASEPHIYNLALKKINTWERPNNHPTYNYEFNRTQYGGFTGTQLKLAWDGIVTVGGPLSIQDASGGYLVGGSIKPGINGLETNTGGRYTIVAGQEVRINAPYVLVKKLKVSINASEYADYVFAPEYNLRSLASVEKYIKKYKHLPDIPSAKEVEKDDMDLGATQVLLLRKIEELTLYMIKQDKEIKKQQEQLTIQKRELQSLKKKI
jgi:hypothetical protein